jgi:undecaprenyl-diphosphatase
MLEQYNQHLFSYINAPAVLSGSQLLVATTIAERLIWLIPAGLILLWLLGSAGNRQAAIKASLAAGCALLVNQGLALIWFHPRPFMIGVGHTFLNHVPDSSFPSDHVTLMLSSGLALITSRSTTARGIGWTLVVLTPGVAWARIFLGVHYPFDMLGALAVAAVVTMLVNTRAGRVSCRHVTTVAETVYRRLFGKLIARGLIRA